jgi:hypothetical protein
MAGLAQSAGLAAILTLNSPALFASDAGNPTGTTNHATQATARDAASDETPEPARTQAVKLVLRIAGLSASGCDVEIKPATPACRFRPLKRHVGASGELDNILIKDLEVRGADRNVSFAITVNEQGQKPRTILRGFRLAARPAGENASSRSTPTTPSFVCWLSSPSKLARLEESTTRK